MIDPENVTMYNQTEEGLEEFALFWVCAAGKNGRTAARCLNKFLNLANGPHSTPFEAIRMVDELYNLPYMMKACGIGCYTGKARSFMELASGDLNLSTCSTDELESIYGIGMKTSRCFIMHSREDARCAGLDTHMLKHLRAMGIENVPKTTPGSEKEYLRLEKEVLKLADENHMAPAAYDLMVWNQYSVKSKSRII